VVRAAVRAAERVAYEAMRVLVLNPGSSSLKSSVIDSAQLVEASIDATAPDTAPPASTAQPSSAPPPVLAPLAKLDLDLGADASAARNPARDIRTLLARYEEIGIPTASLGAVGYRIVQGGGDLCEPVFVTPDVIAEVDALRPLAPLHNGIAVSTMRAGLAEIPQVPHIAVFDTAFHSTLPEDAYRYAVPTKWYEEWGVRRYGFHGTSVAWSVERAATILSRPATDICLVVAHLGSGCSVTATDRGRSVATSMGLTPLEGLMMGTRSGSLDPGIVFYLLRQGRMSPNQLADQLDHNSGLLGVSGRSSDVRELLRFESEGDAAAGLALTIFVRRAAECIAAAATSLPKLDAIVFTGGIGENAAEVRCRIIARLGSIGVAPIPELAVREDAVLSAPGASPAVLRIEAREDLIVARAAARLAST
jgi:acetate kinase